MGFVRHVNLGGELAHHLRRGGDLSNRFLLHAHTDREGSNHHRRPFALHDLTHDMQHLVVENFPMFNGAQQRLLRGNFGT